MAPHEPGMNNNEKSQNLLFNRAVGTIVHLIDHTSSIIQRKKARRSASSTALRPTNFTAIAPNIVSL
jgi:hypothetical protein